MKKLLVIASLALFVFPALSACGEPCEKAINKMEKCAFKGKSGKDNDEAKKMFKEMKSALIKSCKSKDKIKKHFKKCLGHDGCKKFEKCMDEVKLKDM